MCPSLTSTLPLLALEQHSVQEAILGARQLVSTLLMSKDESPLSPLLFLFCSKAISRASRTAFMHAVRVSCWDWHCASHGDVSFVLGVLLEVMTVERISELCDAYQGFLAREEKILMPTSNQKQSIKYCRSWIRSSKSNFEFRLDPTSSRLATHQRLMKLKT